MKVTIGNSKYTIGSDGAIIRGPRGYSAYQVAVEHGFTGTEEEWLASLQGSKGEKGDPGERGIQGPRGQQGEVGPKPEKGVDYFTEEDIDDLNIPKTLLLTLDNSNYKMTATLKNRKGEIISVSNEIDLPLESVVVNARYDNNTKSIILVLDNGNTISVPIGDVVSGLVSTNDLQVALQSFYTKPEIDEIMDEASQDISEVINELAYSIPTKTSDLTNDSNYVRDTDYASARKGGVIKSNSSFGTYVNSNGFLNAATRTYEQYQNDVNGTLIGKETLENVIAGKGLVNETTLEESQALQDEVIEKNTKDIEYIQTLSNLFEKSTGTATELTLNNTEDTQLKIGLKGNTYQETTEGKNLYNVFDEITPKTRYTTVDNDGWITMQYDNTNGSQTGYPYYSTNNLDLQTSTQYNLMIEIKEISGIFSIEFATTHNYSQNGTNIYTASSNLQVGIKKYLITTKSSFEGVSEGLRTVMSVSSGNSAKMVFRMSVLTDTSLTTDDFVYEPYTGNQPAPSPDYPQDIQVVTGDNQIDISNKNLLKYPYYETNITRDGVTFTVNNDGSITIKGTATATSYIDLYRSFTDNFCEIGKTYTYSITPNNSNINLSFLERYNNTWNTNGYAPNKVTFTVSNNSEGQLIRLLVPNGTTIDTTVYPQLEKGSTATSYVEHQEQNYPISLGDIELCKTPDYQDYIHKDNGKWYLHKEINKYILDGSYTTYTLVTSRTNTTRFGVYNVFTDILSSVTNNLKSNYFSYNTGIYNNDVVGMWYGGGSQYIMYFSVPNSIATTETEWKSWLSTHNIEVYYALATPTETEITDTTLISQLNDLQYAMAYKDQTNINQVNDDMPFELDYETFVKGGIFWVDINDSEGKVNHNAAEIYQAVSEGRLPMLRGLFSDSYNIVPIVVSMQTQADAYILIANGGENPSAKMIIATVDAEGNFTPDEVELQTK